MIALSCSMQLTKTIKQEWHLLLCYSYACVLNLNFKLSSTKLFIINLDADESLICELHGVFDKVNQYLLYAACVTKEPWH